MKRTISKILSLVLSVALLCTVIPFAAFADVAVLTGQRIELTSPAAEVEAGTVVEIPATISNPDGIAGIVLEVTWDPTLLQADTTFKLGKYNCFTYPAQNSDGVSIQDAMKNLNVDNAANGKLVYGAAAGYSFDDYTTPLSAGTFKFTVLEAAKGKDVVVTVAPVSVDAAGNVNGGTYATDANKINYAFDTPVNATIKVKGDAVQPEINGIEVAANAVEIADADKADEAKIIAAVKAAITAITVKWTEGKADTTVTADDATYSVDLEEKVVTVTYEGYTDDVAYTVAAPVTPPVGGVPVLTGQRIELTSPAAEVEAGTVVEIPATISNPDGIAGIVLEVTWDPTLLQADTTFKLGKYNCFTYPAQNSDGVSIQDAMKNLNVDNAANGKLVYGAAAGYSFDDYTTPLSAGTFKFTVLEAAKGKDVVVTVSPVSVDAAGNVNGGTYATDANKVNYAFDTPVNATIKVKGETQPPVVNKYTVTFQVGNLVVGTITKDEGQSIEKTEYPAVEPKEGHSIVWDNEGPITESTTVYGTYVANTYKVTYIVDGETVHEDEVKYGEAIPEYIYTPAEGYTFSDWDAQVPETMPAQNLVFNGTTEEIPAVVYTVTFIVMGEEYATIEVEEDTAIGDLMPADPEVAAYIFNAWCDETGAPVTAETIVEKDMEVTADLTKDAMDVNGDNVIDSKDSIYLLNHCALPDLYPVDEDLDFDFNEDGVVNSKDAVFHLGALALPEIYSLR